MSHRYDPPDGSYTTRMSPGMRAFVNVTKEHFGFTGHMEAQVVRDRSRCQRQRSAHCECRACDYMTRNYAKGRRLFEWAMANQHALGIQGGIFWTRTFGFGRGAGERAYGGSHDHKDHVHLELNKWAAANLTEEMVRRTLPGAPPPPPPAPPEEPVIEEVSMLIFKGKDRPEVYITNLTRSMHIREQSTLDAILAAKGEGLAEIAQADADRILKIAPPKS